MAGKRARTVCLPLDGQWTLSNDAGLSGIAAPVPGCVHDALLGANLIPDPWFRDNERHLQWVGEREWVYQRRFELLESDGPWYLECDGLDTLAEVVINGHLVGTADNMFRRYRWPLGDILQPGENEIVITFSSCVEKMREKSREYHLPAWNEPATDAWWGYTGRGHIRKQHCQFGWDWGYMAPSAGVWRSIRLVDPAAVSIAEVVVHQDHREESVALDVRPVTEGEAREHHVEVELFDAVGTVVARVQGRADRELPRMVVEKPRLWWPNGLGEPYLYTLKVCLRDEEGREVDAREQRIGLRTIELVREPDEHGTSFYFAVNGRRFFARGGNWIPLDQFPSSRQPERMRRFLVSARYAHHNMIRVWGGGYYPDDGFYDLCDELGLLVWQDLMFACGAYPLRDEAFVANCLAEVEDNARRLRHHPSLALWCGNNECEHAFVGTERHPRNMSWEDYLEFFDHRLAGLLEAVSPGIPYIPGSGHSTGDERRNPYSERSGDMHTWDVWFSPIPFEHYRKFQHRFMSEFGFQSAPEPRTVAAFSEPGERHLEHPMMAYHERSQPGIRRLVDHLRQWFGLPARFEDQLWLTQIVQALGLKIGIEHWRRNWPRCGGALYWQLNDCWPGFTWSSIDCFGRWKALHYLSRHFFKPLLISGVEAEGAARVEVHLHNDGLEAVVDVRGTLFDLVTSEVIEERTLTQVVPSGTAVKVAAWDFAKAEARWGLDRLWLRLEAFVGGEVVSENAVYWRRPKDLRLARPGLELTWEMLGDRLIELSPTTTAVAPWTWVAQAQTDVTFSDNFFCLYPEEEPFIYAEVPAGWTAEAFVAQLTLHAVADKIGL